jgi:DNA-binding FadR family transcriptional regulator
MAELVASELRGRIIRGELRDGAELPREADLLEEFDVSRPSLREAVRILETEGLLRIRRGKIGGAIVQCPTPESAAYHLGLTLQSRATTLDDVAVARAEIEPTCAALAASLPNDRHSEVVAKLNELIDQSETELGETYPFTASALRLHEAIVELCGNTTISILTSALEAVWNWQERQWAEQAAGEGEYPLPNLRQDVIKAHRRIVRYITNGDGEGARNAMRNHLAKAQPYVKNQDAPLEMLSSHG